MRGDRSSSDDLTSGSDNPASPSGSSFDGQGPLRIKIQTRAIDLLNDKEVAKYREWFDKIKGPNGRVTLESLEADLRHRGEVLDDLDESNTREDLMASLGKAFFNVTAEEFDTFRLGASNNQPKAEGVDFNAFTATMMCLGLRKDFHGHKSSAAPENGDVDDRRDEDDEEFLNDQADKLTSLFNYFDFDNNGRMCVEELFHLLVVLGFKRSLKACRWIVRSVNLLRTVGTRDKTLLKENFEKLGVSVNDHRGADAGAIADQLRSQNYIVIGSELGEFVLDTVRRNGDDSGRVSFEEYVHIVVSIRDYSGREVPVATEVDFAGFQDVLIKSMSSKKKMRFNSDRIRSKISSIQERKQSIRRESAVSAISSLAGDDFPIKEAGEHASRAHIRTSSNRSRRRSGHDGDGFDLSSDEEADRYDDWGSYQHVSREGRIAVPRRNGRGWTSPISALDIPDTITGVGVLVDNVVWCIGAHWCIWSYMFHLIGTPWVFIRMETRILGTNLAIFGGRKEGFRIFFPYARAVIFPYWYVAEGLGCDARIDSTAGARRAFGLDSKTESTAWGGSKWRTGELEDMCRSVDPILATWSAQDESDEGRNSKAGRSRRKVAGRLDCLDIDGKWYAIRSHLAAPCNCIIVCGVLLHEQTLGTSAEPLLVGLCVWTSAACVIALANLASADRASSAWEDERDRCRRAGIRGPVSAGQCGRLFMDRFDVRLLGIFGVRLDNPLDCKYGYNPVHAVYCAVGAIPALVVGCLHARLQQPEAFLLRCPASASTANLAGCHVVSDGSKSFAEIFALVSGACFGGYLLACIAIRSTLVFTGRMSFAGVTAQNGAVHAPSWASKALGGMMVPILRGSNRKASSMNDSEDSDSSYDDGSGKSDNGNNVINKSESTNGGSTSAVRKDRIEANEGIGLGSDTDDADVSNKSDESSKLEKISPVTSTHEVMLKWRKYVRLSPRAAERLNQTRAGGSSVSDEDQNSFEFEPCYTLDMGCLAHLVLALSVLVGQVLVVISFLSQLHESNDCPPADTIDDDIMWMALVCGLVSASTATDALRIYWPLYDIQDASEWQRTEFDAMCVALLFLTIGFVLASGIAMGTAASVSELLANFIAVQAVACADRIVAHALKTPNIDKNSLGDAWVDSVRPTNMETPWYRRASTIFVVFFATMIGIFLHVSDQCS